jgi:hypothetical protein
MGKLSLADHLGSMNSRQRQIEKNDGRLECSDETQRISAVACFADDMNSWIEGQERRQGFPNERMVVHQ